MKLFFYLGVLLLFVSLSWGQSNSKNFNIELSDEQDIEKKGLIFEVSDQLLGFVSEKNQLFHLVKLRPVKGDRNYILIDEIYDKNLKLQESKQINTKADNSNLPLELESFESINGRPILFYSQFDKQRSTKTLYVKYFGKDEDSKQEKKLMSFKTESKSKGGYDVVFSPDSTLFMVVVIPQTARRDNFTNKAYVFDQELDLKGEYEIEVEHPVDKVRAVWFLNNAGQPIYVLSQPRSKSRDGFGNIEKSINVFKTSTDIVKFNLDIKEIYIEDLKLAGESDSELVFLGSFTRNTKKNVSSDPLSCLGTVYLSVDKNTFEVKKKNTHYFSDNILQFMRISPARLQKGYGIQFLTPRYAWLTEGKNAIIVLSIDFERVISDRSSYRTEYVSGLKMVVKFDNEGKMVYERIAPTENQINNEPKRNGLHWHAFKSGENVLLLYNTHEKNLANMAKIKSVGKINKLKIKSLFGSNKGIVVLGEFNEVGNLSNQIITKASKKKMWVAKTQVYAGTDLFYAALASKDAFVVLKGDR